MSACNNLDEHRSRLEHSCVHDPFIHAAYETLIIFQQMLRCYITNCGFFCCWKKGIYMPNAPRPFELLQAISRPYFHPTTVLALTPYLLFLCQLSFVCVILNANPQGNKYATFILELAASEIERWFSSGSISLIPSLVILIFICSCVVSVVQAVKPGLLCGSILLRLWLLLSVPMRQIKAPVRL